MAGVCPMLHRYAGKLVRRGTAAGARGRFAVAMGGYDIDAERFGNEFRYLNKARWTDEVSAAGRGERRAARPCTLTGWSGGAPGCAGEEGPSAARKCSASVTSLTT